LPVSLDVVAGWVRLQAHGCAEVGSHFYAGLLEHVAGDIEAGGPAAAVFSAFTGESGWSALALRLMGSVHRLVLTGQVPGLAEHYPSAGGDGDAELAWPVFRSLMSDRSDQLRVLMRRGCQTNEVGRSAALLGGFLEVARRTRLPLRILEIGASAGLNLRWDHYRYEAGPAAWGDPRSPVRFSTSFERAPRMDGSARVGERMGCDLNPIDPVSDEGLLTLRSFIWADQLDRFDLLNGAIEVARRVPARVEQMDAASFLRRELAVARPGLATVVYHSVFLQYLDDAGRQGIADAIRSATDAATPEAPIFRLAMEPRDEEFEVRLDGELLGTSGPHGTRVSWS
jgi:hypothetical protein